MTQMQQMGCFPSKGDSPYTQYKAILVKTGMALLLYLYFDSLNPKSYTTSNKKLTFLQNYLRIPFIFTNFAQFWEKYSKIST